MTAQPAGHVMWTPDPVKQRLAGHTLDELVLTAPFEIRLPIRDVTP